MIVCRKSNDIMTTHNLLALVFAVSCFALSACNVGGTGDLQLPDVTSYPARILSTTQQGCPPEDQQQMIIAEIQQDIILNYLTPRVYNDCKDALDQGQTSSGVYNIKPDDLTAFDVYCDMDTDGGGWTVFQRRMDGSVDFYLYWTDYVQGFGNLSGEFWLGLEKIHRLTSTATELRVDLQDFNEDSAYAKYTSFSVGDSASKYILSLTGYTGTAGDSLGNGRHNGHRFSTRDQDNENDPRHCAQTFTGGWWYSDCRWSNLNGVYLSEAQASSASGANLNWETWRPATTSLKFTEMKLRRPEVTNIM